MRKEPTLRKRKSTVPPAIQKKREALTLFTRMLLSSPIEHSIGRIILFGSLRREEARSDSDVDVLIIALDQVPEVEEAAAEAAMEAGLRTGESVEPLVYCLDELRHPSSYFLYQNLVHGEEVYSMDKQEMKAAESRGYGDLAREYLEAAQKALGDGYFRMAVDAGHNAAELCVKGLLLLKVDELPTSHGGVTIKFGEIYIKDGPLSKDLGRALNRGLALRNKSRYDPHAIIHKDEAEKVLKLAEKMIHTLEEALRGGAI